MTEETRSTREYPARPIVGVAGVVLQGDKVLLIRRGRAPLAGAWSLPGGALRTGERMVDGVIREVLEETAIVVEAVRQVATLDRILRDEADRVQFHYVLIDWLCRPVSGETDPIPGSDATEAAWVSAGDLARMPGLDQVAIDLIQKTMLEEGGA